MLCHNLKTFCGKLRNCVSAIDVVWVSTHTFMVAYLPQGSSPDTQPVVILTESAVSGTSIFSKITSDTYHKKDVKSYGIIWIKLFESLPQPLICVSNAFETTEIIPPSPTFFICLLRHFS